MYKGERARLRMLKILSSEKELDEKEYSCNVLEYYSTQECVYLVLLEDKLEKIQLDAVYSCVIEQGEIGMECVGNIVERYKGSSGKTMKMQIKNGFYKINLK